MAMKRFRREVMTTGLVQEVRFRKEIVLMSGGGKEGWGIGCLNKINWRGFVGVNIDDGVMHSCQLSVMVEGKTLH